MVFVKLKRDPKVSDCCFLEAVDGIHTLSKMLNDANFGGPPQGVGVAVAGNGRSWVVGNFPCHDSLCAHSLLGCV